MASGYFAMSPSSTPEASPMNRDDTLTVEQHLEWREKVERYVDEGDRGTEPCFVGRTQPLETVARMARSALRQPANRTVAVFGAPGAGKSALLSQLIEQHGSPGSQVLPVRISASSMNPLGVFDAVARAVGISRRGETVPATQVDAEAKIMGVGGGVKSTSLQRQASDRAEIQAVGGVPWELMRDRLGATVRGRVVLLLCDGDVHRRRGQRRVCATVDILRVGRQRRLAPEELVGDLSRPAQPRVVTSLRSALHVGLPRRCRPGAAPRVDEPLAQFDARRLRNRRGPRPNEPRRVRAGCCRDRAGVRGFVGRGGEVATGAYPGDRSRESPAGALTSAQTTSRGGSAPGEVAARDSTTSRREALARISHQGPR